MVTVDRAVKPSHLATDALVIDDSLLDRNRYMQSFKLALNVAVAALVCLTIVLVLIY